MRRSIVRSVLVGVVTLALAVAGAACDGGVPESAPALPPPAPSVQLAPENVVTAEVAEISTGPTISGQLTPARQASVRAQVGGSIVELSVDRGQPVLGGATIARIASRDLDMAFESSKAAVSSAATALSVATAERQRTDALVKGGALAARDLEQARNAVSIAEAQLAAARARQSSVGQQIDDTTVKAPFSGIVSARAANLGDVVAPGAELVTIIDPSSMRLEALVPSDQIEQVERGANAHFSIRGVSGDFVGVVDRISPSADPVTRQVSIFVTLPNVGNKLIAGLFAEGRVDISTHTGIVVPLSAVDETGPSPVVTRIRSGKAERVIVALGPRKSQTEQVEVTTGLAAGDLLVVGSARGIAPGTSVRVVQ